MRFPVGVTPGDEGPEVIPMPLQVQAVAEGAVALARSGGLWGKSRIRAGSEYPFNNVLSPIQQEIVIGFYKRNLFGLGLRWDWNREGQKPISAIEAVWGIPGNGLGQERPQPLWITTLSWEIPRETQHMLAYFNAGLESIVRPNSSLGFCIQLSSRVRSDSSFAIPSWVGFVSLASQFRLPILRPFQWTLGWEGALSSPLTDMGLKTDDIQGKHGFFVGLGYMF